MPHVDYFVADNTENYTLLTAIKKRISNVNFTVVRVEDVEERQQKLVTIKVAPRYEMIQRVFASLHIGKHYCKEEDRVIDMTAKGAIFQLGVKIKQAMV